MMCIVTSLQYVLLYISLLLNKLLRPEYSGIFPSYDSELTGSICTGLTRSYKYYKLL